MPWCGHPAERGDLGAKGPEMEMERGGGEEGAREGEREREKERDRAREE